MSRFDEIVTVYVDDNDGNEKNLMLYREFLEEFINDDTFGPSGHEKQFNIRLGDSKKYYILTEWVGDKEIIRISEESMISPYNLETLYETKYEFLEDKYHETLEPTISFIRL